MASPPIPPTLIQLAARPFSFYPAIAGAEPNQWRLRKADWQELVVINTRTSVEISIPRRYVGEISPVGDPVLIVGLLRELQYIDGEIRPLQRRVVEMPIAVGERVAAVPHTHRSSPAPVIGIRLEPRRSHRIYKISGATIAAALLILTVVLNSVHPYSALAVDDDYATVIHKLGRPLADKTAIQSGREYRALVYRRFIAILSPDYIGAVDNSWKPLTPSPVLSQVHRF